MVRLALLVSLCAGSLAACGEHVSEGVASMDIPELIVSLERAALDRWITADPDGYLSLYAEDATYFDPFRERRVDGRNELNARMAPMRGMALPFTEPRYEMLNPVVHVGGNVAVLTFNLVNYGKPSGSTEETILARWNATQVYRQMEDSWQIIHTHWSFTQPRVAAPAEAL